MSSSEPFRQQFDAPHVQHMQRLEASALERPDAGQVIVSPASLPVMTPA